MAEKITLQRGDIFCVRGDTLLAKIILAVQAAFSTDGKAEYSHTGIIVDTSGITLEALSTIRNEHLYEKYRGFPVIIGRHQDMTEERFLNGMDFIQDQVGKRYPWWRLLMRLNPAAATHVNLTGRLDCAALACKFLKGCGLIGYFQGMVPDTVAEMIINHKRWIIVYEGRL